MTKPVDFEYRPIGDQLYAVNIRGKKDCAVFRLIEAPNASPPSCKQLDLHIFQEVSDNAIAKYDVAFLLQIYGFVFEACLEITHENKGIALCKLYSRGELNSMVYRAFATKLSRKRYDVKWYGPWIEISRKDLKAK